MDFVFVRVPATVFSMSVFVSLSSLMDFFDVLARILAPNPRFAPKSMEIIRFARIIKDFKGNQGFWSKSDDFH